MDGFVALVYMTIFNNPCKCSQLLRFVSRCQCQVGVFPVAQDAQPNKILPLLVHLLERKLATGFPEHARTHTLASTAVLLLFDLVLDGQTVTVPPGYIGRIVAVECSRFDDDVLQHFIDSVADMNGAVGVRRAIRQFETWTPCRDFPDLAIDILSIPFLDHSRLSLGQVCPHGKIRFR